MNIQEISNCPVCLNLLKSPVILNCSHNICYDCANQLISLSKLSQDPVTSLLCPYCRHKNILTFSSAEGLAKNKVLESLLEDHKKSIKSSLTLCSLCRDFPQPATHKCISCEAPCCQSCSNLHISKARFAEHKIIQDECFKKLCVVHNQELDQFCYEDKLLICSKCLKNHEDHTIIPRAQAESLLTPEINKCRSTLLSLKSYLLSSNQMISSMMTQVQSSEDKAINGLTDLCNKSIEKIKVFRLDTGRKIQLSYQNLRLLIAHKQNFLNITEGKIQALFKQSSLQVLQEINYFAELKSVTSDLVMPVIIFKSQQLPMADLTSPKKFLYYMNRGTNEFYSYNVVSKELAVKELPSTSPVISRWSSFITLADGRILVTGGKVERNSGSHRNCIYIDPHMLTYTTGVPMLKGHSSHISLRMMGKVFVISGKNEENICDSFCEVLDCYGEFWSPISRINYSRTCAAGCWLNESIYVLGGFQNTVSNTIERYSLESNAWTLLDIVLPEKIWQHGCFALDSKRIIIFGGEKDSDEPNKVSFIYDTSKELFNSTTSIESIPVYLYFWIQVIRDEDYLLTINKEKTLVKYFINDNKWTVLDIGC